MGYVKNTWVDQDVERPKTYEVTTNQDGSITLTDSFGLVTELGTPVNATNMNHIEDGLALTDATKYDATVTYSTGEWVTGVVNNKKGIYSSKVDNNTGNALSDTTKWEEVQLGDFLPDQTGHSGDLLTTDGTDASWVDTDEVYPVVETYSSGTSWYRVYSDGFCEQGGFVGNITPNTWVSVTLLKPYINTNYTVIGSGVDPSVSSSNPDQFFAYRSPLETTGFYGGIRYLSSGGTYADRGFTWQASGYIS